MIDRITEIVRLYEMNECNPTWCPPEARIFPTDDSKCRECIAERIHRAYLADGWVRKAANQRVPQPIAHCVCGGQAHIIGGYPHSNSLVIACSVALHVGNGGEKLERRRDERQGSEDDM